MIEAQIRFFTAVIKYDKKYEEYFPNRKPFNGHVVDFPAELLCNINGALSLFKIFWQGKATYAKILKDSNSILRSICMGL